MSHTFSQNLLKFGPQMAGIRLRLFSHGMQLDATGLSDRNCPCYLYNRSMPSFVLFFNKFLKFYFKYLLIFI